MSILLEALRRSEKIQRTHDTPTIYGDDHSDPVSEPIGTASLALLLVAALFITGWLVWRQYQAPVLDNHVPAASAGQAAVGTRAPAASAGQVAVDNRVPAASAGQAAADTRESPDTPIAVVPAPATDLRTSAVDNSPAVVSGAEPATRQRRTPVESYQPSGASVAAPKTAAVVPPDVPEAPVLTPEKDAGKMAEPVTEKRVPEEPAAISYWDLPDAVRVDLPEIKFSVLVYANNPADRFVLINGVRLAEGDSPQPGLIVKEIRRDGVVFTYRLYQFLVER